MTNDERMALITTLANDVTNQVIQGLIEATRCCITCEYWIAQGELCGNKINCPQQPARPPATIIAYGCPNYKPGVPF